MAEQSFRQRQMKPIDRRAALAGLAMTAFAPLGCFGIGKHFTKQEAAKPVPQGRLVSTWEKRVIYAPDAYRGGAVIPGLAGRVYLFAQDMTVPYVGDGKLVIDLWDGTPRGPGAEPIENDHFFIDAGVLKLLAKKDGLGLDSYSIFFPWANYRPDIAQVYLNMLYTAANGDKYFHQSGTFALDHSETSERMKKGMSITSAALQQVAAPHQ